jgi:aspartyl protease family protein
MVRFFTVKWPRLARLEAALLFVAILVICGRSITVRSGWSLFLAIAAHDWGMPERPSFWGLLAMIVAAPYFCAMVAVDRLLTVRKGFAILSILSVSVWAAVAAALSADLAAFLPADVPRTPGSMEFTWKAAVVAGSASLLVHGAALWTGLTDRGFVGLRLAARSGGSADGPDKSPWSEDRTNPEAWFAPNPRGRTERDPGRGVRATLLSTLTWVGVFAVATAGYIIYHRVPAASPRLQQQTVPLPRVWIGGGEASSARRDDGHFVFETLVNRRPVSMLFDTGASMVTLRAEDAVRLGVVVGQLKFSTHVATANGTGLVAPVMIDSLTVGGITQHGVPAFVASPGTLSENLLGQSFLRNLQNYKVEDNHVVLKSY